MKCPSPRVALLLTAVLLLGGCGSETDSATDDASSRSTDSSSASTSAASSSPSASPSATGVAPCRTSGLKVTLGPGEGAAGSTYFPLHLRNNSSQPCHTGGFGGVSLVATPQGRPIGAPADRSQGKTAKQIVLRPGATATATLQLTSADNFSRSKCQPKQAAGFRVYPPNETHSAFVAQRSTACSSAAVHLLTLRPYQAG